MGEVNVKCGIEGGNFEENSRFSCVLFDFSNLPRNRQIISASVVHVNIFETLLCLKNVTHKPVVEEREMIPYKLQEAASFKQLKSN